MLSVDRVSKNCWLLSGVGCHAIAWLCSAGSQHQLVLGEFDYQQYQKEKPRLIVYQSEVYSTFFWAKDPVALAEEIIHTFAMSPYPKCPIELVYAFGGHVDGRSVRIAPLQATH